MARKKNPGTVVYLELDPVGKFKYVFIAFGHSIRGFSLMRRVIVVDGTFLKENYKGTLLASTAQDGDFHLYPIAFAIVDSENDIAWNWFFRCLLSIIPNEPDLVFVSDHAQSIEKAISELYPASHHGICKFHLQNNIKVKFRSKSFLPLVEAAANAYTFQEFEVAFRDIQNYNPKLAKYLEEADFRKWARGYAPSNYYNIMTTNITKSLNSMLNDPRELPVISLLETIRLTLTTWFNERQEKAVKHNKCATPNVTKEILLSFNDAMK
ncbi:PREDICTED: protein FAR1-RELATED SEQUENCE 8-like [Camelina sativa]|uniref:Protein FAR1-RELATED SEQUENCE 8-like n=1 Tax=Camelina sativa TaxID=90675 RepID=A0ABM0VIJ9_CAMSA|nr:PREDICTED: protein FAR1-RELATED SEQUENCE 8-like [Camelina sativa]